MLILAASDSLWPPILAALVGAFIGGLGGQVTAHMLASGRERRQKLREAYAALGGVCFRFLDLKEQHVRLSISSERMEGQAERGMSLRGAIDQSEKSKRWNAEWDRNQEEVGVVFNQLDSERCKLQMLLGDNQSMLAEIDSFIHRMTRLKYREFAGRSTPVNPRFIEDGKEHPAQVYNMRLDLKAWMTERALEIDAMDLIKVP